MDTQLYLDIPLDEHCSTFERVCMYVSTKYVFVSTIYLLHTNPCTNTSLSPVSLVKLLTILLIYASVSKHTIVNTIVRSQFADNVLQLSVIKSPMRSMHV